MQINRVRQTIQLFRRDVCDWVFWIDADAFITNYNITLEDILEKSNVPKSAHFVFNRDESGEVNTGVGFIRKSEVSIKT